MIHSRFMLASGLCSLAGMMLVGVTGASAEVVYVDEGAYAVPPAYVAPTVPPSYYVVPQAYVAAPAYAVPVAPPAYAAPPAYVERVVPAPRNPVIRGVTVERRPAYPRYDYGYVTYDEW
jgi:hypothetical protein